VELVDQAGGRQIVPERAAAEDQDVPAGPAFELGDPLVGVRAAEERGFSALATIDRIVYPSYDSLAALAAVAGATTRIGLMTNILLAPVYTPVLLAKTTSSIDQISTGRLTLGLAPGGRPDDFVAAGRDFHTRGRDLDAALEIMHRAWRGEPFGDGGKPICPTPVNDGRIPIVIGGTSDNAIRRVAAWGAGWTMGGGAPGMGAPIVERVRTAWQETGRDGEPRLAALTYFSLGSDAENDSRAYLRDYYGFLGEYADRIAESALRSESAIRDAVRAFEDIGITELYFDPTTASLDQVDRLADMVL
jgi:alkanesulfonate monooxygenase SsuD/methylene tetrahydromethanopterin reductase-like flavin-dependent oxidoreductase (luciferase family)